MNRIPLGVRVLDTATLVCTCFSMLFALIAQFSLPTPTNARPADVRAVFSADDFPADLQGFSRTVLTRTTVQSDGTTQSCVAEVSSGDPKLDAYTCEIIVKRAKFRPANWSDGSAVYGVVRVPVRWHIGQAGSDEESLRAMVPDLDLSVTHLPKGAHSMAAVSLWIEADEKGRPLACIENPVLARTDHRKHFPELVSIACDQVTKQLTLTPPLDASGKPVRSVQSVSVRFKVGPQ